MAHGTHTIFVGEVDEVRVGGETAPLLYQEGAFHRAIGLEVTS
jgi:flavin reductase (DIM6/NTAB) family NADH-FMN oxidoreductase RutF